jgi:hypothetical protein
MLKYNIFNSSHTNSIQTCVTIDGQKNKYSVLNECNRMLKYNILQNLYYI